MQKIANTFVATSTLYFFLCSFSYSALTIFAAYCLHFLSYCCMSVLSLAFIGIFIVAANLRWAVSIHRTVMIPSSVSTKPVNDIRVELVTFFGVSWKCHGLTNTISIFYQQRVQRVAEIVGLKKTISNYLLSVPMNRVDIKRDYLNIKINKADIFPL